MGYGSYSSEAHAALISSRKHLAREEVFRQRGCHPLMNPFQIKAREARDSEDHPDSVPIVFALDVTGSMGHIPDNLARKELPTFMSTLLSCGITDPQVMFVAVGDATCDRAPLQVGQFESEASLIDQWLTWSYLEGGGGGSSQESYELALYFLARHTALDSMSKRNKRGYLLMTGDELPYPSVARSHVKEVLGWEIDDDVSTGQIVDELAESYEPFFLIPDRGRRARCERAWRDLLGDRVICLESPEDTCLVSALLLTLNEGLLEDVAQIAELLQTQGHERRRIARIVRTVTPFAATLGADSAPRPHLHRPGVA